MQPVTFCPTFSKFMDLDEAESLCILETSIIQHSYQRYQFIMLWYFFNLCNICIFWTVNIVQIFIWFSLSYRKKSLKPGVLRKFVFVCLQSPTNVCLVCVEMLCFLWSLLSVINFSRKNFSTSRSNRSSTNAFALLLHRSYWLMLHNNTLHLRRPENM